MFCPNCGAQIPDDSAFCENCGVRLGGAAPQPQQPAYQQPQQPVYQQAQQPVYQQAQYQSAQQPQKKNVVKYAAIGAAVVALFLIGRAVVSNLLDDDEPVEYRPNQKIESVDVTPSTPSSNTNAGTGGAWNTDTPAGDPTGGTQVNPSAGEDWESYTTYDLSVEADFDWYYDRSTGTVNPAVPAGAVPITDPESLFGGWKCFVMRRPMTEPIRQYWNLDLSIVDSEVACIQTWSGQVKYGGTFVDESAANENPLFGSIDRNCVMELEDDYGSKFTIIQWYSYNGKQYGVGTYECGWDTEDTLGLAAVCRP